MYERLYELAQALKDLGNRIPKNNTNLNLLCDRNLNFPAISGTELYSLPHSIAAKIDKYIEIPFPLTEENATELAECVKKTHTLTEKFAGNLNQPSQVHSYLLTLMTISHFVDELFLQVPLPDAEMVPSYIHHKLQAIEDALAKAGQALPDLDKRIASITTASALATDLEHHHQTIKTLKTQLSDAVNDAEQARSEAKLRSGELGELSAEGTQIVEQSREYLNKCEEALRISTSQGLSGAFSQKAKKLNRSARWWTGLLVVALGSGAGIGYVRSQVITDLLNKGTMNTTVLVTELLLSILCIGAPLWLAWLATKQINKLFRLTEDYGFKAAVARSYEGYRKESLALDNPELQSRLFDSALNRFDEAPLRLMTGEEYSSPWMEMLNSEGFKKFINAAPEQLDVIKSWIKIKPAE